MKSKITLAVLALMFAISAQAQVVVKNKIPDLRVDFKRCIVRGDMAFIDLVITNASERDTKINFSDPSIYDDEGNVYVRNQASDVYIASGSSGEKINGSVTIPGGIPYKIRLVIESGFDEYAAIIALAKLEFTWNVFSTKMYGNYENGSFELRNLPIIRE